MTELMTSPLRVTGFKSRDLRFRTSTMTGLPGSDAINPNPDYSNPVFEITSDSGLTGVGATFTLGLGNDQVCDAMDALAARTLKALKLADVLADPVGFWRRLITVPQIRWCGPESGVVHLAAVGIHNAVLDLWAKSKGMPLWKLLCALTTEELLRFVDFRYLEHLLTRSEAEAILDGNREGVDDRVAALERDGLPSYLTVGWIGYPPEQLARLVQEALDQGWRAMKVKVGDPDPAVDEQRVGLVRGLLPPDARLMIDANQVCSVRQAIDLVQLLRKHQIYWFEEPTGPYSVSGHKAIRGGIGPYGVRVATGENCQNQQMATEFLAGGGVDTWQLDAARMSVPENLAVMLLARKLGIPICPHAGGSGLCVMVPHLAGLNFARFSPSFADVMVEYTDIVGEYFEHPAEVTNGRYVMPTRAGYLVGVKPEAYERFGYPSGQAWK